MGIIIFLVIAVMVSTVGIFYYAYQLAPSIAPLHSLNKQVMQKEAYYERMNKLNPESHHASNAVGSNSINGKATIVETQMTSFQAPLARSNERITKKPFGIFITPQNSSVKPERFYGYHTGTDFETFPEEQNTDVIVHVVCSGPLLVKRSAQGYGGVAAQSCNWQGQPITVVYGHLRLSSIAPAVGSRLQSGDTLGVLGTGYSNETSGERKHLHLSFHKGKNIDIRGYVPSSTMLKQWMNPCDAGVCK
jgi:hypothetical protein